MINALANSPACSPDTKLQIIAIARGVQGEITAAVLEALARQLHITPDNIKLVYAIQGTVHLLVSVPEMALAQTTNSLNEEFEANSINSVTPFNSLNRIAQITWRVLAVYLDIPSQSLMQMDFYWGDAVRIIRKCELTYQAQQAELPEEAKYLYCAGAILLHIQRWNEAVVRFTKALEVAQRFAAARLNRGIAYEALGRKTAALADYDAALDLDPNSVQAYNCRGALHANKGYLNRALEDFGKAMGVDPQFLVSYLNHGATLYRLQRYGEAIADFSNAIRLDPKAKQAYLGRGLTLAKLGHDKNALKDFDRACELDPDDPRVYLNRGIILERLQRYQDALADYQAALSLEPDNEQFQMLVNQVHAVIQNQASTQYYAIGNSDEPAAQSLVEVAAGWADTAAAGIADMDFANDRDEQTSEEE